MTTVTMSPRLTPSSRWCRRHPRDWHQDYPGQGTAGSRFAPLSQRAQQDRCRRCLLARRHPDVRRRPGRAGLRPQCRTPRAATFHPAARAVGGRGYRHKRRLVDLIRWACPAIEAVLPDLRTNLSLAMILTFNRGFAEWGQVRRSRLRHGLAGSAALVSGGENSRLNGAFVADCGVTAFAISSSVSALMVPSCSQPSETLRAACGGALRASWTAAARVGAGARRSGRQDGRLNRTTG